MNQNIAFANPSISLEIIDEFVDTPRLTRKRANNSDRYAKKIRKMHKDKGLEYQTSKGKQISQKSPKPPCICRQKCFTKFTEDERHNLNRAYWDMADFARQRDFLKNHIKQVPCKRSKSGASRQYTFYYKLHDKQVCKNFFTSTLNIGNQIIHTLMTKIRKESDGSRDGRGRHKKTKLQNCE